MEYIFLTIHISAIALIIIARSDYNRELIIKEIQKQNEQNKRIEPETD